VTLEQLSESWGLKAADSGHIYINAAALRYTGTPSDFEFEGQYDEEFPAGWAEFTAEMKEHDRAAMQLHKKKAVIETDYWFGRDRLTPWVCEQLPVYNAAGAVECILWNAKPPMSLTPLKYICQKAPSILTVTPDSVLFTTAEHEIIFLLLQRYAIKEIARLIHLCPRTVGNRVQEFYYKVNVHSYRQFEEYCRLTGLNNFIPPRQRKRGIQPI
jgi:DNA-binding CsgD family transcriptional regulator